MSDQDTDSQNNEQQYEQPRYYAELVEQILSELESFFATGLEEMFKKADDHLFDSAQHATSTAEQNRLFEAMNALRESKQLIQHGFIDELSFYLQPVSELEKLPEKKKEKPKGGLGLVEQTEMDKMVALTGISSKAASDNAESISQLIKRLKELAQYNDHIFHGEALEPKIICDSLHDTAEKTQLEDDQRLVLYRYFDQVLVKKLGALYETLNDLMIAHGILPEIDYSMPDYEGGDYVEEGSEGGEEGAAEMPPTTTSPPVPPGGRRAFGSGMRGYGGSPMSGAPAGGAPMGGAPMGGAPMGGAPMGGAPMGGAAGSAPMSGGVAAPRRAFGSGMQGFNSAPQAYSAGAESSGGGPMADAGASQAQGPVGPASQVRQSIENFIGGSNADVMSGGGENYYSHQQVMTALTVLQEPAEDLSQTPLVFDANQIKKAVLSSIGETEGGAVTKAVHHVSEKTIDFIKLIFDAIIEEESITDEIKTLLLSLQIPVIKAAMIDSDFFVDDQHPARLLLDKITEAGVGVSEHTDPVYIEIEKVVRKLLSDYHEDVIAFEIALKELNRLTEEIYRKARETEAKSRKAVKMAHAKTVVLQEIRKITIGKELPHGIRTLVLKVWPSMMFNHYMENGKANDEWVELLMILQKIIESVQPLNTLQELEGLGLTYNDILTAAKGKLDLCRKNRNVIESVVEELSQTYEALMATTGLPDENEPQAEIPSLEGEASVGVSGVTEEVVSEIESEESIEELSEEERDFSLDRQEAMAEPEPEERDPEEVAREKISRLPEGVAPGAWFIVYNGEDKPVRRLKLAVILVQDATMVFVDHLGNVVIEKDAEEFTDEIDKGLSGIIMQHSVFDHALANALQSIER